MRVALVYPPDFNRPTMIFGALPLFNACLKNAGHETLVADLNAEAFTYCLRPGNLDRYFELFDRTLAEFAAKERTPIEDAQFDAWRRLRVFPRDLMLSAGEVAKRMKIPEHFYDPDQYRHMDRVIRTTHAFLNSFTPQLDPRHNTYTQQLYAYLRDDPVDPYLEYYLNDLIPRLKAFKPDLIAMSCPFSPQVATGMFLAKHLRREFPQLRYLIGGTGVSDSPDLILGDPRFYDYVDYAIVGDGEEALPDLCRAMEGDLPFEDVAGLWRRHEGAPVRPGCFKNIDLDTSPVPDYRDVDFSHYQIPEKAGIYTTSRGCYYGKCTFCPESFRVGFRKRSPERVYEDVKNLVEEQGVRFLHFFDPLTPPVTLEYLSRQVARDNLPLQWYAEVKFEKIYTNRDYVRKLAEGGCRQLQFGFESGVQRVLDRMKKGNKLGHIKIILKNLQDYGITMAGTWFIGFPTETEDEARETWRYWRTHPEQMHLSLYTGTFSLGPEVPVYNTAEEYDCEIVYAEDGYARAVPLNGVDWDKEYLHTAFHVRSDIELTICAAGLLYASYHPEKLYRLRNVNMVGPTSFDGPPLRDRFCKVTRENNRIELEGDPTRYLVYVAESLRNFEVDEVDYRLLERIGSEGVVLGELLDATDAPADLEVRLARFIDRGYIESRDPLSLTAQYREHAVATS